LCYSSGDGALHFVWSEDCPKNGGNAANRKVIKADVDRYLKTKDAEHLVQQNWLPVLLPGDRWVLVKYVRRLGPNRISVDGHTYTYKIDKQNPFWKRDKEVIDCGLILTFAMKVKGKAKQFECMNGSIRMVVRYFLNHEKELTPIFKAFKPKKVK
jgi:hypothetical protein